MFSLLRALQESLRPSTTTQRNLFTKMFGSLFRDFQFLVYTEAHEVTEHLSSEPAWSPFSRPLNSTYTGFFSSFSLNVRFSSVVFLAIATTLEFTLFVSLLSTPPPPLRVTNTIEVLQPARCDATAHMLTVQISSSWNVPRTPVLALNYTPSGISGNWE